MCISIRKSWLWDGHPHRGHRSWNDISGEQAVHRGIAAASGQVAVDAPTPRRRNHRCSRHIGWQVPFCCILISFLYIRGLAYLLYGVHYCIYIHVSIYARMYVFKDQLVALMLFSSMNVIIRYNAIQYSVFFNNWRKISNANSTIYDELDGDTSMYRVYRHLIAIVAYISSSYT